MDNELAAELVKTLNETNTIIYSRLTDMIAMTESLKDTINKSSMALKDISTKINEIEDTLYNYL